MTTKEKNVTLVKNPVKLAKTLKNVLPVPRDLEKLLTK